MKNKRLGLLLLSLVAVLTVALIAVFCYWAGRRVGYGACCYEVAMNTQDSQGRSLSSLFLSKPGAVSDYTCWGTHCSISIGYPSESGIKGGHWVYVPREAKVYANDDDAEKLFPGAGRWLRQPVDPGGGA